MASEYFLDANIVIYFLQDLPAVRAQIERHTLRYLPFVTAVTNDDHFEGIPGLVTENWTR